MATPNEFRILVAQDQMHRASLKIILRFGVSFAAACLWSSLGPVIAGAQEARAIVGRVNSSDGVPIAYEVRGEGSMALVFVHGWSCDRSYWTGQLEHFSRQLKVVAVDLGGHGESGLGRKIWTMESFGEDAAVVVKQLGLQRVVLIGHSMGGDVILEAARRLPGRVAVQTVLSVSCSFLDTNTTSQGAMNTVTEKTFREQDCQFRRVWRGVCIPNSAPGCWDRISARADERGEDDRRAASRLLRRLNTDQPPDPAGEKVGRLGVGHS